MTLSLRHIYIVFVLALIAAFSLHARADNWFTRMAQRVSLDGLGSNGEIKDSTNCIACGSKIACGSLEQRVYQGKTLASLCQKASEDYFARFKSCGSRGLKFEAEKWRTFYGTSRGKKRNFRDLYRAGINDTFIPNLSGAPYYERPIVTVPSKSHWAKLVSDRHPANGRDPRYDVRVTIDETSLPELLNSSARRDLMSCVDRANKSIEKEIEKEKKQANKEAKQQNRDYFNDVFAGALDLNNDFSYRGDFDPCNAIVERPSPPAPDDEGGGPAESASET